MRIQFIVFALAFLLSIQLIECSKGAEKISKLRNFLETHKIRNSELELYLKIIEQLSVNSFACRHILRNLRKALKGVKESKISEMKENDIIKYIDSSFGESCKIYGPEVEAFMEIEILPNHPVNLNGNHEFLFNCSEFLNSESISLSRYIRILSVKVFKSEIERIYHEFQINPESDITISILRLLYLLDTKIYNYKLSKQLTFIYRLAAINAEGVLQALISTDYIDVSEIIHITFDYFYENHVIDLKSIYYKFCYKQRNSFSRSSIENLSPDFFNLKQLVYAISNGNYISRYDYAFIIISNIAPKSDISMSNLNLLVIVLSLMDITCIVPGNGYPILIEAIKKLKKIKPESFSELFPQTSLSSIIFKLEADLNRPFAPQDFVQSLTDPKEYLIEYKPFVIRPLGLGLFSSLEAFLRYNYGYCKAVIDRNCEIGRRQTLIYENDQNGVLLSDNDYINSIYFISEMACPDFGVVSKRFSKINHLDMEEKLDLLDLAAETSSNDKRILNFVIKEMGIWVNEVSLLKYFNGIGAYSTAYDRLFAKMTMATLSVSMRNIFAIKSLVNLKNQEAFDSFISLNPEAIRMFEIVLVKYQDRSMLYKVIIDSKLKLSEYFARNIYYCSEIMGIDEYFNDYCYHVDTPEIQKKNGLRAALLMIKEKKSIAGLLHRLQPNLKTLDYLLVRSCKLGRANAIKSLLDYGLKNDSKHSFSKQALVYSIKNAKENQMPKIVDSIRKIAKKQFKRPCKNSK